MPARPRRARHRKEELVRVRCLLRHIDVADALSRHAQRLGPGIANDRILVNCWDKSHLRAVIHQLPIRFVRDDVDRVPVLRGTLGQQRSYRADGLLGQDRSAGVVRRIQDHGLRVLVHGFGKRRHVHLKLLQIRRDKNKAAAVCLRKGLIFHEIGRDADDLALFRPQRH